MKIVVTAREIMDKLCWDEFCELKGINLWAVNEGLMDEEDTFELTEEEAKKIGLR